MSGLVAQQAGQMLVCHRLKKNLLLMCSPIYLLGNSPCCMILLLRGSTLRCNCTFITHDLHPSDLLPQSLDLIWIIYSSL